MSQTISSSDNINLLQQTLRLLENIGDDVYRFKPEAVKADSMGAHLRHVLDHYFSLGRGLASGEVDYDKRERDPRIAEERLFAGERIREVITMLRSIDDYSQILRVKMDCGQGAHWTQSTVGRELQFLLSHHIHHNAIVKMALEFNGVHLDEEFGVAPATIKYRHLQKTS